VAITVYDASVVIALMSPDDAHHESARSLFLRHREERGVELVLPAPAYAETLVHPRKAGDAAWNLAREFCREYFRVLDLTAKVAEVAAGLRADHQSLRLPDALVLATADTLGAASVATADARWPRYAPNVIVLGTRSRGAEFDAGSRP